MRAPCPAPGCRRVLGSSVGLYFHLKAEHPEGPAAYPAALERIRGEERAAKREAADERGWEKVDHLYRLGCPCGRTPEWHAAQRHALEVAA